MRIQSERQLNGRARDDDALAAYAAHLTSQWDRLTALFPAFASVEDIAIETALVMWARRNGVRFDPVLWLTPPRAEITPDYAPLLARLDGRLQVAGGVTVTPEDKRASSGRALITMVSSLYSDGWGGGGDATATAALVLLAIVIGAGVLLVLPSLLWLLAWLWGEPPATGALWRFLVARWAAASGVVLALAALTHPLAVGGVLGPFDRDFLAFLVGVAAFPVILLALLRTWLRGVAGTIRAMAVVLAVVGSALAGQLGLATALLTVAANGPVPTPAGNTVLALQLAAADRFSDALLTVALGEDASDVLLMPRSAFDAVRPGYASTPGWSGAPPPVLRSAGQPSPTLPFDTLSRIPLGAAAPAFYGPDGALPF